MLRSRRFAVFQGALIVGWFAVGSGWTAVVRGDVRSDDGEAVAEAVVALVPVDAAGVRVTAPSNRAGAFLFGSVRPGRYEVHVEASDRVLVSVIGSARSGAGNPEAWRIERSPTPEEPVAFDLAEGQDVELALRVGRGIPIGGAFMTVDQALDASLAKIRKGDCVGAEGDLTTLIAADPEVPKAHYLRGFCRGSRGKTDEALEDVNRTLGLNPAYPGAALLKAQLLTGAKRVEEAEGAFRAEIATAARPELIRDAWWGLGLLLRDGGSAEGALEAFERSGEIAGGKPEAWIEAAEIRRATGDLAGAERSLSRAAAGGAPVARPLLNLGVAFFNEKRPEEAARVFQAAADADGATAAEAAHAYGLLGKALLAAGKSAEGRTALERSLEIAPNGEFAAEARKLLEESRR